MTDNNKIQSESEYNNITVICNEINDCIIDFCQEQNINDIKEISQSVYSAMLMYINSKLFKNTDRLKNKPIINNGLFNTNFNAYNTELCYQIMEYYVYISKLYDKEVSLKGFEYLTGICQETLNQWGKGGIGATSSSSEIVKRLRNERENSLSEKLLTGKNPVGVLGILNHFYGWAGVGNMDAPKPHSVSLADIQKQAGLLSDNLSGQGMETAKDQPIELSDNSNNLEKPVK